VHLIVGTVVKTAIAQEQAHDTALAHDLFDAGRALMSQKQYERACEKFEESRKVDPGRAGGTLLNLALCQEVSGKTATAWALFREARSIAIRDRRDDRREFAEQHIAALEPRLSRLRITVAAGARVPGLVVKRNGVVLAESAWGESLIADPGPQRVDVSAPGKLPLHLVVTVSTDGRTEAVSIPPLEDDPAWQDHTSRPTEHQSSPFAGSQRVWAVAVGTTGVLGAGIGGLFGVLAERKQRDANALCPNYDRCDPGGLSLSVDASNDARTATALVVSGAIAFGIGVVLFLTAPRVERRGSPTLTMAPSASTLLPGVRL
jgi:hypothetical protein